MAGAWISQTELASHDCGTWVKRGAKSSNDPTLYTVVLLELEYDEPIRGVLLSAEGNISSYEVLCASAPSVDQKLFLKVPLGDAVMIAKKHGEFNLPLNAWALESYDLN